MSTLTLRERMLGGLWGAVTGDALGVPVEFQDRASLRRNPVTGMRAFGTHRQPAGTWSDDSSLLLCSVESLAERGEFDSADLAQRFIRWERHAHWSPHGDVFDIGIATSSAIGRLEAGVSPELAGGADVYDNGNGSLMRILPNALAFYGASPENLAKIAARSSSLTHRHPRSQMACVYYCLFARELMMGQVPTDALSATNATFAPLYAQEPFHSERLSFQFLEDGRLATRTEYEIDSSGYVMHTLSASLWCLLTSASYEETVLKAVNLGGDTDTTCTVAGGLAGLLYGVDAIPADWRCQLARRGDLERLFTQFLQRFLPTSSSS